MSPSLTLYRVNGSCSIVAHALLRHLSVPFKQVVLKSNAQKKYEAADGSFTHDDFLKISPMGYVPLLRADEVSISEMPAVLAAIVHFSGKQEYLGRSILEKAKVIEWTAWLSGTLHSSGFGGYWRPYRYVEDHEEAHSVVTSKARKVIEQSLQRIDRDLGGRQFAVGHGLTVVDFNLYVFARWAGIIGVKLDKQYPAYAAHARQMEGLDAVGAMIEEEGLERTFNEDGSFQKASS